MSPLRHSTTDWQWWAAPDYIHNVFNSCTCSIQSQSGRGVFAHCGQVAAVGAQQRNQHEQNDWYLPKYTNTPKYMLCFTAIPQLPKPVTMDPYREMLAFLGSTSANYTFKGLKSKEGGTSRAPKRTGTFVSKQPFCLCRNLLHHLPAGCSPIYVDLEGTKR